MTRQDVSDFEREHYLSEGIGRHVSDVPGIEVELDVCEEFLFVVHATKNFVVAVLPMRLFVRLQCTVSFLSPSEIYHSPELGSFRPKHSEGI